MSTALGVRCLTVNVSHEAASASASGLIDVDLTVTVLCCRRGRKVDVASRRSGGDGARDIIAGTDIAATMVEGR